eukprot:NODE_5364_length_391_cov_491.146199_g4302_i0.p1 GENE.NODE_5364_length_391_cov_491.146199_g4302_i0~~NODE_5364_length_391_cov_491.146199_g4302_i0.p1  ORF type:complete len:89 (-),score=20.07 NODE_5364_length_391_cov_491.146199_g4302_i0:123-365(-)
MGALAFFLYEYVFRVTGWDTFYFYADSEFLRVSSLFFPTTDREAYDWKKYTMETGREYYYSPTLGISCQHRPKNYMETGD